jgi:hypothetical protein
VGGRYGLYIVPGLRRGVSASALDGLDRSAGVPSFSGLTLMALNWSLDDAKRRRPKPSRLQADRDSASVLGTGPSRFATVRRGDTWFAVKSAPGPGRIRDLRFDFGLAAFKRKVGGSRWVDVVPLKPYTQTLPDSAGPILDPDGRRALPYADDIDADRDGRATVTGGWRTDRGAPVRTGARFRFQARGCGVRISWPARRGDRFELSTFFRKSANDPEPRGSSLVGADQVVRFAPRARVTFERRYASASDAKLIRARLRFVGRAQEGRMRVTICRR